MGIKADALRVLSGIDMLSEAYSKAKGKPMFEVSVTKEQWDSLEEAITKGKIPSSGVDLRRKDYKGIVLHIR